MGAAGLLLPANGEADPEFAAIPANLTTIYTCSYLAALASGGGWKQWKPGLFGHGRTC